MRRAALGVVTVVVACGPASPSSQPSSLDATAAPSVSAASPSVAVAPSPSIAPGIAPTVRLVGDGPVLRGRGGPPGYTWVLPGAAIEHDGVIHAWLVWFAEEAGKQIVTHASSSDGRAWTVDPEPAYTDLGLGLYRPGPIPADVRVEADGTWVLYGWGTPDSARQTFAAWRATASGPDGPWVAEPILGPADQGHWDDNGVILTSVIPGPDGLELYYEGASRRAPSTSRIGLARSLDGTDWTRVSPSSAGAEGGPVLEPGQCAGMDRNTVTMPNVTVVPDGRLMLFTGFLGNEAAVGAATSPDGLTWRCAGTGPILERSDIPGSEGIHTVELFERASGPTLLVESLGDATSDVWLAELATD